MEVPHEIWLQLTQWFQRRYLKTDTHTNTHIFAHQNTTAESCSRWNNGGGALKAKHYIFVGGGEGVAGLFFFVCFLIQWADSFCENLFIIFCRWWSSSKMQFVQMGSVGMKKVPIFRRGLSRKTKWVMRVPWWWRWLISWPYRWWFSREVKFRRYTVLYPGKTRLKPRLFLPAVLAGN